MGESVVARSIGKALRRFGSDDLKLVKQRGAESVVLRHYVQGHTAARAAKAMNVAVDEVERLYDAIRLQHREMDNDAFRLKLIAILTRSEQRSAKFRQAVRFFEKANNFDMVPAALKNERVEDEYQVMLLTKYLITDSTSVDEMGRIAEAVRSALNDGETTDRSVAEEREVTVTARHSEMRVHLRGVVQEDAAGDGMGTPRLLAGGQVGDEIVVDDE